MKAIFLKVVKHAVSYLASFIPKRLPQGRTEFNSFAEEVIRLSGLPDNDSMRFALATMILHLGPTDSDKPKRYFVRAMQASAAKQVAGALFHEIKEAQKRAAEAAASDEVRTQ